MSRAHRNKHAFSSSNRAEFKQRGFASTYAGADLSAFSGQLSTELKTPSTFSTESKYKLVCINLPIFTNEDAPCAKRKRILWNAFFNDGAVTVDKCKIDKGIERYSYSPLQVHKYIGRKKCQRPVAKRRALLDFWLGRIAPLLILDG